MPHLADLGGLAADAAACAIAGRRAGQPVELLEQGRGVLWSQLLETRTDLHALQEVAPGLAARLDTVRSGIAEAEAVAGMLAAGGKPQMQRVPP